MSEKERSLRGANATYVAAFLLSDHQPTRDGACTCGDELRADLTANDRMAAHQATILEDAGVLVE